TQTEMGQTARRLRETWSLTSPPNVEAIRATDAASLSLGLPKSYYSVCRTRTIPEGPDPQSREADFLRPCSNRGWRVSPNSRGRCSQSEAGSGDPQSYARSELSSAFLLHYFLYFQPALQSRSNHEGCYLDHIDATT